MNTSTLPSLPPGSVTTGDSQRKASRRTPEIDAVRAGQLKSAEALRRKAYRRLAQTIGISWLDCRRTAFKS